MVARPDIGERDIGALGEHRMVFQQRAYLAEIIGIDIVDPEHRMRIAHVDHGRRMQDRLVDRSDLQLDGAGIAEFLRQRDFVPGKTRHAHVDGRDQRRFALPAVQEPGAGLEDQRALAGFLEHQLGDAAHAVAAGAGFGTVIVVDAHKAVGAGRARRVQRHELIVGRAARLRRGARFVRRNGARLSRACRPPRSRCRGRSS